MPKPLIGLTTSRLSRRSNPPAFGANVPYARSVSAAGGLPVLIPSNLSDDDLESLALRLDGILFTGGSDIDPARYGNPLHNKVIGIDKGRDHLEMQLVRSAVQSGKPFFGICRGCQVINVALGGSLYEDLGEQYQGDIQHDNHDRPRDHLAHTVITNPNSRLASILGSAPQQVNSLHHQGICRLSQELIGTAEAPDKLIEAVELTSHSFGVAVQWHPEELQAYEPMRLLFQRFIQACQNNTD